VKKAWKIKPKSTGVSMPARPVFAPLESGKKVTFLGSGGTNILIYNPVTVNFLLGEKVTFMPLFQWFISAWSGETAQKPVFQIKARGLVWGLHSKRKGNS
jgi:hypothetical protein